jgi:hypothetical protein
MTIPFTCPHCGTQTDVYEQYAGLSGPCAVCGKMITVPGLAGPAQTAPSPDSQPSPPRPGKRRWSRWLIACGILLSIVVGGGVLIMVLVALVFPAVSAGRRAALKSRSSSQLQAIVVALKSYEADHGSLPPAYVPDANGRPMHSWRVLLLPYLGYDHVYERYDFSQAWDSAQNMQLLTMMPAEYASPADPDALSRYEASYVAIVGPRTAFPGSTTKSFADIADDLSQTIIVAETPTFGVIWLQPTDLSFDQMRFVINGREGVEIGSRFPGGANVGLADGSAVFLPDETPPESVQAMTTIAGNEAIPWYEFP